MMRSLSALLVLAALVVPDGCAPPTQITVHVSTDLPCDKLRDLGVAAGAPGELPTVAGTATSCAADGALGTVVIVPSGAKDAALEIAIFGALAGSGASAETCTPGAPGCIVARRRLRFQKHTPVDLPIALRAASTA